MMLLKMAHGLNSGTVYLWNFPYNRFFFRDLKLQSKIMKTTVFSRRFLLTLRGAVRDLGREVGKASLLPAFFFHKHPAN